ncbi:YdcF family protein [Bacillus sp. HMF5848]|uniref:YdcF family protein n=1 Tax=Bacillus sp. HMF5848 TaxID=2495421 RepID=UPI000F78C365|nr:YdcF family protein [Bacillus sp. HMF5848]RSK28678.1 YdcF family protein [Bacillus sp. HMF5848]
MKKFFRYILTFIILAVVLIVVFRDPLLQEMKQYLYVEEPSPIPASDAIIVLGSDVRGERTIKAAELFREGLGSVVILSDGGAASWRYKTVDEMYALAVKEGIPTPAIIKEDQASSTKENAMFTKRILEESDFKSAIVISTDWHMRRVKQTFDKAFVGTGIELTYVGATDTRFLEKEKWWEDPELQQTVLTEWSKLIVYWWK